MYKIIDLDVLGIRVTALSEILTAAERLGFAGLNITYPCKQAVIEELDELSPDAHAIGAVNTVIFRHGRRFPLNWTGFVESSDGVSCVGRIASFNLAQVWGLAIACAATLGVRHVVLIDTDRKRARDLAEALCARFGVGRADTRNDPAEALAAADGLVNTTPVGMAKFPGMAFPPNLLSPHLWVAEIIYFPLETELLRMARECGCRTMSGAGMAVFQAVEAFRLFSGAEPDAERMLAHFAELTGAP